MTLSLFLFIQIDFLFTQPYLSLQGCLGFFRICAREDGPFGIFDVGVECGACYGCAVGVGHSKNHDVPSRSFCVKFREKSSLPSAFISAVTSFASAAAATSSGHAS